ncbi:hypothetical protein ACFFNY_26705 [Paenibacillus hodogayensis]|uniref:PilZ domain-containing protein n=1 Tax=Paenibacillus hodogayensis TaxID=279208 RepID=A0ABV5W3N6_9BACL
MSFANKRKFHRLMLAEPLYGTLKIVGLNEKKLDSKLAHMFILDLGAGGVRIHSVHSFPVTPDLLLEFGFTLFHTDHRYLGTITRKSSHSDKVFEYGIAFSLDETERQRLLQSIHLLSIRLRQGAELSSCSFCNDEQYASFYGVSLSESISADRPGRISR